MVIVAQLGARMHYAVPAILHRSGMLERLYTDIYAPRLPKSLQEIASRYGPPAFRRGLGRVPADIPEGKIVSFPALGLEYYRRRNSAASQRFALAAHLWAGQELCRRSIKRGLGSADCVYAYNTAGLELLEFARTQGVFAVMEQTSAPDVIFESLREAEESNHPQWARSRRKDPLQREYMEREQTEWQTADLILCGSEFVREGIRATGGPVDRCCVVPYGVRSPSTVSKRNLSHSPLRVLTVGAVAMMKGAPYVLAAARALKGIAEFRMAGQISVTPYAQKLLSEHVNLLGAVPRAEIHREYAWADVFLLPSICEGSATVCYEALAHALPVITTPNAGSVVRDGVDGFVVPIRDAKAIADRVQHLADDPDLWAAMSASALARAAEFTLEKYGERLVGALDSCRTERC